MFHRLDRINNLILFQTLQTSGTLFMPATLYRDYQMCIPPLVSFLLICLLCAQASPTSHAGIDKKGQLLFQLLKGNEQLRSSIHCEEPFPSPLHAQHALSQNNIENTLVLSDAEIPISSARVLDLNLHNNAFIQSYGLQILDQAPSIFEERNIQTIILLSHTNSKSAKMACLKAQEHRSSFRTPNDLWPPAFERLEKQQQKSINCHAAEDIDSLSEVHLQTTVEALKHLAAAVPPKKHITVISMMFDVTTGEVRLLDLESIPSASSIELTAFNSNEKPRQDPLQPPAERQTGPERNAYHATLPPSTQHDLEKAIHTEVIPQPSDNVVSETNTSKNQQTAPDAPSIVSESPLSTASPHSTPASSTETLHIHSPPLPEVIQDEEHPAAHEHNAQTLVHEETIAP